MPHPKTTPTVGKQEKSMAEEMEPMGCILAIAGVTLLGILLFTILTH